VRILETRALDPSFVFGPSGKGQTYGPGTDRSAGSAAAQVRHAPKHALFAAHQMAANVVQARRLAPAAVFAVLGRRHGLERGVHFDMIEQWAPAVCQALAVDGCARDRHHACGIFRAQ
jgi:hypothetical protein